MQSRIYVGDWPRERWPGREPTRSPAAKLPAKPWSAGWTCWSSGRTN